MANKTMHHLVIEDNNYEILDAKNRANIAAEYSASSTYNVGDVVLYNGQLYKCTTAITTAEAWTAAHWTAVTVGEKVADLEATTNDLKEDKAEIDGYYEDMTVGDAEQLVASQYVEDSVPYNFRTTGGSADVGNREYVDAVVGGTVALNQLFNVIPSEGTSFGVTLTPITGGARLTGTATATTQQSAFSKNNIPDGEKVLIFGCPYGGAMNSTYWMRISNYNGSYKGADTGNGFIYNVASGIGVQLCVQSGYDLGTGKDFIIHIIDLTQMFGTAIADYIYSLETANAGAGVAWFKKLFPNMDAEYSDNGVTKKLRDYQPGTLISVGGVSAHKTVGFNQWDEEWELGVYDASGNKANNNSYIRSKNYVPVSPNTSYYYKAPTATGRVCYYDEEKTFISRSDSFGNNVFITPYNCRFITFFTNVETYNHDICINLSWSGWRNGEYEAYQKHSYPLDDSLTLRGIPKLDAQNNLYYDGDEYLPSGQIGRRYVLYNAGGLNWTYNESSLIGSPCFYSNTISTMKAGSSNFILPGYVTKSMRTRIDGNMQVSPGNNTDSQYLVLTNTSYTDPAELKASLADIYWLLELAAPTTETAEPYQPIQVCDDFGTEEYVSTSIVPVGHNTRYPANLRDKLQHLPDLADDDGYYMIGQNNKQMHLELFRIPKAPTTDGTYTLKATVSGGTPTYTWEAQT